MADMLAAFQESNATRFNVQTDPANGGGIFDKTRKPAGAKK